MTTLTGTQTRLKGALAGLQDRVSKAEKEEARQKNLAALKKTEEGELASLKNLETNLGPALKDLEKINWATLGRKTNIGGIESDVQNVLKELGAGMAIHETVLAAFEGGGEPSDELITRALAAGGLAKRLESRIEEATVQAERLAGGIE
jgi:hypothetical protein